MSKILAVLLFSATVLFICGYAVIDRANQQIAEKHFFTIKETHNLFNDEKLMVNVYDNQNDTLIVYAYKADAYLMSLDESTICKVKVENVTLNQQVLFDELLYNEYILCLSLDVNELSIENAILKLEYPNQEVRLHIGDVNFVERPSEKVTGLRGLCGLVFENPFLSVGGIVITIENPTENKLTIEEVRLDDNHLVSVMEIEEFDPNTTKINEICDYQYNLNNVSDKIEISAHSTKTLLLQISYEKDILLRVTPVFFNINGQTRYIDAFNYVTSNDLNNFKNLIHEGYVHDF